LPVDHAARPLLAGAIDELEVLAGCGVGAGSVEAGAVGAGSVAAGSVGAGSVDADGAGVEGSDVEGADVPSSVHAMASRTTAASPAAIVRRLIGRSPS